ncbi:MAG: hypothetical protein WBG86_18780 [Polyangiales bacterium]
MHGPPLIDPPPPDANLRVSVDLWPIVLVTIDNELLLSDVEILHRACDQVFAVEDRHAFIVDCSTVRSAPGPEVRRALKLYEDSRQAVSARKGVACSIVFQSAVVRGAYTALRWMSAQPVPNKAFSTVADAAAWCIEAIESEGGSVPAAAHTLAGVQAEAG